MHARHGGVWLDLLVKLVLLLLEKPVTLLLERDLRLDLLRTLECRRHLSQLMHDVWVT